MAKEDEYVINGLDTLMLAELAASSRDRLRLLELADSWLALAERVRRRRAADKPKERPSPTAMLGREQRQD